jgi:hypothetical protein
LLSKNGGFPKSISRSYLGIGERGAVVYPKSPTMRLLTLGYFARARVPHTGLYKYQVTHTGARAV